MNQKTIIRVNANVMKENYDQGTHKPCVMVRDEAEAEYTFCQRCQILDGWGNVVATIRYEPNAPLACGARCWIETTHAVVMEGAELQPRCTAEPARV